MRFRRGTEDPQIPDWSPLVDFVRDQVKTNADLWRRVEGYEAEIDNLHRVVGLAFDRLRKMEEAP